MTAGGLTVRGVTVIAMVILDDTNCRPPSKCFTDVDDFNLCSSSLGILFKAIFLKQNGLTWFLAKYKYIFHIG